jgi:hypothetical protein
MLSPANIVAFTLAVTISLVTPAALTAEGAKEAWEALATGGHIALICACRLPFSSPHR